METGPAYGFTEIPILTHLWGIEAVQRRAEDLVGDLGCFKGKFSFGCTSLLAKDLALELKALYTRYELMVFEREEARAKALAKKEL